MAKFKNRGGEKLASPDPMTTQTSEVNLEEENTVKSVYEDYSKDVLDKGILERRVVVLYFIANWCGDCLNQDATNWSAITSQMANDGIVGLRVHILDSQSTTETSNLSKKYGASKENTFVVLDENGAVKLRHTGFLSEADLVNMVKRQEPSVTTTPEVSL